MLWTYKTYCYLNTLKAAHSRRMGGFNQIAPSWATDFQGLTAAVFSSFAAGVSFNRYSLTKKLEKEI